MKNTLRPARPETIKPRRAYYRGEKWFSLEAYSCLKKFLCFLDASTNIKLVYSCFSTPGSPAFHSLLDFAQIHKKKKPNQNKSYSGNQSSEKWKLSFKRLNTSYHTKVKAVQIVGCCAYQDINYDGLCSKPIGSTCYCSFMKVNETLEIIRK